MMRAGPRVVRSLLIGLMTGMVLLAFSNVARARWFFLGVDVVLVAVFAVLYYLVVRQPRRARVVGGAVGSLLVVVPAALAGMPDSETGGVTVAMLGVGAVLILSLLRPGVGAVGAGVETAILGLYAARGALPWSVALIFAGIATAIYVFARSLLQALAQAEAGQAQVAQKNQELERALQELIAALEQERKLAATVRELEMPLIESERGEGILVLVGYCDPGRMQAIQDALASRLRRRPFRQLVVDVSAARFDEAGWTAFIRILQALRLAVSHIVVSGMTPQQAKELARDKERIRLLQQTATFVRSLQEALVGQTA